MLFFREPQPDAALADAASPTPSSRRWRSLPSVATVEWSKAVAAMIKEVLAANT
jgi:hypothetical protein